MGRAHAALAVRRGASGWQVVLRINNIDRFTSAIPVETVRLRAEIKAGGSCAFSYAINDEFIRVPAIFQAQPGEWIGAKVGLYCLKITGEYSGGHADFDYFRFT